jgi:hypothetical protein
VSAPLLGSFGPPSLVAVAARRPPLTLSLPAPPLQLASLPPSRTLPAPSPLPSVLLWLMSSPPSLPLSLLLPPLLPPPLLLRNAITAVVLEGSVTGIGRAPRA